MADYITGRGGLTRDEVHAWQQDLARLGAEGRYFFSLNRYLFLAGKPAADDATADDATAVRPIR